MKKISLVVVACSLIIAACDDKKNNSSETTQTEAKRITAPTFSGDSAYTFIEKQIAIGPRVPNTPAHIRGGDYIVAKLKSYGVEVIEQPFTAKGWDGILVKGRNIIGVINPKAEKRLLFSSHWDSRRFSDNDSLEVNHKKPVPAANDGASGVAVLLEMARVIQQSKEKPTVGVDLIF